MQLMLVWWVCAEYQVVSRPMQMDPYYSLSLQYVIALVLVSVKGVLCHILYYRAKCTIHNPIPPSHQKRG